ncbi:MAG: hypothetical protein Fur006_37900 [Coleofasciculaceae cyanobacterium]
MGTAGGKRMALVPVTPAFSPFVVHLYGGTSALGARPGTVRKEISIKLPHRTHAVKRHSIFHDYRDELMDLMRRHGQEAVAAAA